MSSRREFLKFLGIGAASAVASPLLVTPAISSSVKIQNSGISGASYARATPTARGGDLTKVRKIKQSGLYGTFRNPHLVTKLDVGLSDQRTKEFAETFFSNDVIRL